MNLEDYSYNIIGLTSDDGQTGTGFFIRKDSILYFITAKHNLTGCQDYKGDLPKKWPSFMDICLKDGIHKISIPTREFRENCNCNDSAENDFEIIKINSPYSNEISSVENLKTTSDQRVIDIKIIGFPISVYDTTDTFNPFVTSREMKLPDKQFQLILKPNGVLNQKDAIFVVVAFPISINIDSVKGFGGAPVFLQNESNLEWRIDGMFINTPFDKKTNRYGLKYLKIEQIIKKI